MHILRFFISMQSLSEHMFQNIKICYKKLEDTDDRFASHPVPQSKTLRKQNRLP